ncbi:MAG TPA: class II aldolase/adducin family protein [Chloroflexia bacterium]|nr:class II aldolase/adducin family protein [Chloroflexia bacterium]
MARRPDQARVGMFQEIGRDIFVSGLCSSHAGNLSVLAPGGRDQLIITRSGAMLGRLGPGDLITTGVLADDDQTPLASSELAAHRAIYRHGAAQAVVHAHPAAAVALSLQLDDIEPINSEGRQFLPHVPVLAPRHPAGSAALAAEIAESLYAAGAGRLMLVRGHGCFAGGATLEQAYQWVSCCEEACKILLYTIALANGR